MNIRESQPLHGVANLQHCEDALQCEPSQFAWCTSPHLPRDTWLLGFTPPHDVKELQPFPPRGEDDKQASPTLSRHRVLFTLTHAVNVAYCRLATEAEVESGDERAGDEYRDSIQVERVQPRRLPRGENRSE